jgi:hypothetical protein
MFTRIRQFHRAEEGAALLIFALTVFIVIGAVAFAIDISRFFAAQSRLSIATERAVVAAAQNFRFLDTAELNMLTTEILRANFHSAHLLTYSEDAIAPPTAQLLTSPETGEVTLTSSVTIPTTLLRMLNFLDPVTVERKITAVQLKPEAEVTLVIEASDAFDAAGRLAEVTTAAEGFIAALEAEVTQVGGIKWALVPFGNEIVNIAPHNDWVEGGSWPISLPPLIAGLTEWAGDLAEDRWCVSPRNGSAGTDATPPATVAFPLVLTLGLEIDGATGLPLFTNITTADCRTERILGLGDPAAVSSALAALRGNGGAAYGRAMIWAERTLSPLWQGLWDGDSSRPSAYEEDSVQKVALLVVGSEAGDPAEQTRLAEACARMKQNGIILYVIDYLAPAATSPAMQACATSQGHYFRVTDDASLRTAFFAIAKFMTVVRFSG